MSFPEVNRTGQCYRGAIRLTQERALARRVGDMRTVLGSSLVNQVERGRTTIRGGAGTRTHTSGSQAPRLHKFKAGMTDRAPEGRSGETAIKSRVKIPASPPLGVRSADRPLPAPFRTGLPGWYSRPFRFGGCPLPLHVPRVPPSRVFRFHAESEFRCARPKSASPPCARSCAYPTSTLQQPCTAESLAQAQSLLAPAV